MLGFWMGVFTLFIIYQIAMVCWDIYYYTNMEVLGVIVDITNLGNLLADKQ